MKTHLSLLIALLCGLVGGVRLRAQSTAFTYQGRLVNNGSPANGSHDFQFTVFNAESGGDNVEDPVTVTAVGVTNGLFTVLLAFPPNANLFNGQNRWLDIAVRPAGNGTFTPLNPRQPITPAPFALTALNALNALTALSVPGVDRHALHAQDGSPTNAVFVDDAGKVGIVTTTPASRFHVVSLLNDALPPRIESVGTNRFGAGFDFYHSGTGKGYVGIPDANAPLAPGEMLIFGGPGTKTSLWGGGVRALTTDTNGNVLLGANAQLKATASEENLRIVRGVVSGAGGIITGSGFTVLHSGTGDYQIVFDPPFAGSPAVTATANRRSSFGFDSTVIDGATGASAQIVIPGHDTAFHFIAIGPR